VSGTCLGSDSSRTWPGGDCRRIAYDEDRVCVRKGRCACTLGGYSYRLRAVIDTECVAVRGKKKTWRGETCREGEGGKRSGKEAGAERGQTNECHCEVIVTAKLFNPSYSLTSARGVGELSRSPIKDSLRLIDRREEGIGGARRGQRTRG
jgi:hypothetical protein